MSDLAISVRGVSKDYTILHGEEKHTRLAEKFMARLRNPLHRPVKETFHALTDINFDIKKGEVVGIIGRNGAGKSTLLKILSRITEPTAGEIKLYGRVASLLEVGTGFHPELTGRENIYLNGAILGMTQAEIRKQFDAIVEFSEVEKFLDTPVKRYSSGMYVRLAFAVAAHLEPEILIVDEVLSVGDAEFQKKCLGKMKEVSEGCGRTVLFVSHNMAAVTTLCSGCIFLAKGRSMAQGPTREVVDQYIASGRESSGEKTWTDPHTAPGNNKIRLRAVRIVSGGAMTGDVSIDEEVQVEVEFWNFKPGAAVSVSIHVLDRMATCIMASANMPSATLNRDEWYGRPHPEGIFKSVCSIPANFLNEGTYLISAYVLIDVTNFEAFANEVVSFEVHETGAMRKEYAGGWIGMIRPKLAWQTQFLGQTAAAPLEESR